jgi:hypothetical protein
MSSDRARLAYKVGRLERCFVSEGSAVDSRLAMSCSDVDAVVDELSPNKEGVAGGRSQYNLFSGTGK